MTAHRDKRTLWEQIKPLREQRWTFKRIGQHLGLSRERCRQLWQLFSLDTKAKS